MRSGPARWGIRVDGLYLAKTACNRAVVRPLHWCEHVYFEVNGRIALYT